MNKIKLLLTAIFSIILSCSLFSCGGDDENTNAPSADGYGYFDHLIVWSGCYHDIDDDCTFTFNKNGTYTSTGIPYLGSGTWRKSTDQRFIDLYKSHFNDDTQYLHFSGSGYEYEVIYERNKNAVSFLFYDCNWNQLNVFSLSRIFIK